MNESKASKHVPNNGTIKHDSSWITLGHYTHGNRTHPIEVNLGNGSVQQPLASGQKIFSMLLELHKKNIPYTIKEELLDEFPDHVDKHQFIAARNGQKTTTTNTTSGEQNISQQSAEQTINATPMMVL